MSFSSGLSTTCEKLHPCNPPVTLTRDYPQSTSLANRMPESKRRKPKHRPQSSKAIEEAAKAKEPSPTWYVALMAGLMVVGVLLVLARFIFRWPQGTLLVGLGAIAAGFLLTTNYK